MVTERMTLVVGLTAEDGVAVKVTVCVAGVIVKLTADEVLGLKLRSPLYIADSAWEPAANRKSPFGGAVFPWLFKL